MSNIQSFFQTSDLFFNVGVSTENLDIKSQIGETLYNANYTKRVIIPSSVTVGSATTSQAALKIPSGAGGTIIVDNYGSIQGAGGDVGGNGGDAIVAQSNCIIENKPTGSIYAGGGGGGNGGSGGSGGQGSYQYVTGSYPVCTWYGRYGCYGYGTAYNYGTAYSNGGSGGSGGSGGVGRGYNRSLTSGSSGTVGNPGSNNSGNGGNGGNGGSGGDWGQPGSSGPSGSPGSNGNYGNGFGGSSGSSGGLAGYYVNGLSSYATLVNSGIVTGRTN